MSRKVFDAAEVAKHNSPESCWVVLYGDVYDVTDFVPSHPGGSKIILQLAGRDATEDYDPVHPPGTLEENLKPEAKLGTVDPESLSRLRRDQEQKRQVAVVTPATDPPAALETLFNLDELEEAARKQVSRKCWAYYFSAGDDMFTKRYNNHVYRSILLRPRVFIRKYCPEVFDHVEVWVDGGIKRGTDVIKALCLGAKAVGVGRAALYGLGAGGWRGVERTFEILNAEMTTCMKLLGAQKVEDLGPQFVNSRMVERDIYDGPAGLDGLQLRAKAKI
ncbi:hypothetical protein MAPG_08247 [Magnaporthiopsis poae ATCC 64411]|uniref:Cytochrome b2 n=1 Tax=Magnaporthiopsis poae (strain ATCC 64411 / 73-15) TaxID=644358 RepID=A0A0C4E6V0_MAGP6|nr:hypothetical protein MAPG_08247 [Magnaporthiopsis poae ATCC 64411]